MDLTELSKDIYQANKEKGFWDEERNTGELLMLVVSELGEAMEALRRDKCVSNYLINNSQWSDILSDIDNKKDLYKKNYENLVKGTFEEEVADALIGLLDLCGGLNIDIQKHVELKLAYNKLRPHKHGKKF